MEKGVVSNMGDHLKTTQQRILQEECLARGNDQLTIRLKEDLSSSTLIHFLAYYRGRSDYAKLVPAEPNEDFWTRLAQARTALYDGNIGKADFELSHIAPRNLTEEGEADIDRGRLAILKGDTRGAIQIANRALLNPQLCDLSRMTSFVLLGQSNILEKNFGAAIDYLKKAVSMAELFTQAFSGLAARAFLVQAYCGNGDRSLAEKEIALLHRYLESLDNEEIWVDRLLTVLRGEVHFHRTFSEPKTTLSVTLEARVLAEWLGDQESVRKCDREILEISGRTDIQNLEQPSELLRRSGWVYLTKRELVLMELPKKAVRLNNSPVISRMMSFLIDGPLKIDDFFEKVWNLKYDPDRHLVHTRAAISKLRKNLPDGALTVKDGLISLG